jgi:hypothetical protein
MVKANASIGEVCDSEAGGSILGGSVRLHGRGVNPKTESAFGSPGKGGDLLRFRARGSRAPFSCGAPPGRSSGTVDAFRALCSILFPNPSNDTPLFVNRQRSSIGEAFQDLIVMLCTQLWHLIEGKIQRRMTNA